MLEIKQLNKKHKPSLVQSCTASCVMVLAQAGTMTHALVAQQISAPSAPAVPAVGATPSVAPPSETAPGSLPGASPPTSITQPSPMPAPVPAAPMSPIQTPMLGQTPSANIVGSIPAQGIPPITPGPAITLDEALKRAQANAPAFAAAVAISKTAALDHAIARTTLLPSVVYNNQFLYTQGARRSSNPNVQVISPVIPGVPTFIANNAVHEYVSQASVTETVSLAQYTALARTSALAAVAKAELEISRRGLTATVISLFYASTNIGNKLAVQQRALREAADFVKQTQEREAVREGAHADVLKAQLAVQQRERDSADAQLSLEKTKIDLGVLLFPDPRSPYTVILPDARPLPSKAEIGNAANTNNPELKAALATFQARTFDITIAQGAYLPALSLNYSYGIDAAQFAYKGRESAPGLHDNVRNLGYSASVTFNIPVFDWFATENKIRQTHILKDAAKTIVSSAQRTLIAQIEEFYNEATLAQHQITSLQTTVDTASESLRLTRLRYTAGEATVLEVVDAQNSLTTAELALTDGTVRYQLALANLQLLTGAI